MSLSCERDGIISDKINKKGVLLQRRDNCEFVRNIYAKVVMFVFDGKKRDDILNYIIEELNKLCSHFYQHEYFIITKSVGDIGNLIPVEGKNNKNKPCYKVGDYIVKLLPEDEKKREKQFKLKNCDTEKEYYLKCLPAQVQLAERMRRRGQLVDVGTRLEYVITTKGGHSAKQYVKVESSDYFMKHSNVLEIDYLYYLGQLANPLDQVLNIMFEKNTDFKKDFVLEQYKFRLKSRNKVLEDIKNLFTPKLKFKE